MSQRSSSSSLEVERRPVARLPQKSTLVNQPNEVSTIQKPTEQKQENEKPPLKVDEDDDKNKKEIKNEKLEKRSRSSSNHKDRKKEYSSYRDDNRYNKDRQDNSRRRSRSRSPYKSRKDYDERKYRDDRDYDRERRRKDDANHKREKYDQEKEYKEDKYYKSRDDKDNKGERYSPERKDRSNRGGRDDDTYNKRDYKSQRDDKSQNRRRSQSKDEGQNKQRRGENTYKDSNNRDNKYGGQERKMGLRQNPDDMYGKKNNKKDDKQDEKPEEDVFKEEPCWIPSGILATFSNNLNGVTLKFTKPLDAEKPKDNWSLFPFKGDEKHEMIKLKGDSAFLIGKDARVCYIVCENPSVSSQHAVIQFREIRSMDYAQGQYNSEIRPYIMDLESTNGTLLNGEQIESAKYIQLLPKDVLRFGLSTRDYVVMKAN